MRTDAKKVFVGLSGGVDSSVAALRLQKAGYDVYGVFIKVWHPDFLVCNWEQERLDAMRVAARLKIPFLTCDAEEAYKRDVADYFIGEYTKGRTPNPDVMCNKYVKFGAFLEFAKAHGADYIATGHYAQRIDTKEGIELHRGTDSNKDQSYFLWTLTQEQLRSVLLPVGNSPKEQIRKEAEVAGLITAQKKDSQGICFLGHVDIPEFLSHYIDLEEGEVKDESGKVVGTHKGAFVYTTGQRHGFSITSTNTDRTPYYVTHRDVTNNIVYVSQQKPQGNVADTITLTEVNTIAWKPEIGTSLQLQIRYRQEPIPCHIEKCDETSLTLSIDQQSDAPSTGQSCVLYDGMQCLGGGIIA